MSENCIRQYLKMIQTMSHKIRMHYIQEGHTNVDLDKLMGYILYIAYQQATQQLKSQDNTSVLNDFQKRKQKFAQSLNFKNKIHTQVQKLPIQQKQKMLYKIIELLDQQLGAIQENRSDIGSQSQSQVEQIITNQPQQSQSYVTDQQQQISQSQSSLMQNNRTHISRFNRIQQNVNNSQFGDERSMFNYNTYFQYNPQVMDSIPQKYMAGQSGSPIIKQFDSKQRFGKNYRNEQNLIVDNYDNDEDTHLSSCIEQLNTLQNEYRKQKKQIKNKDPQSLESIEQNIKKTLKKTQQLQSYINSQVSKLSDKQVADKKFSFDFIDSDQDF